MTDLTELLLVGQGRDVGAQPLKGVVDALHPSALPHVGRVPLVDLLSGSGPAPPPPPRAALPAVTVAAAAAAAAAAARASGVRAVVGRARVVHGRLHELAELGRLEEAAVERLVVQVLHGGLAAYDHGAAGAAASALTAARPTRRDAHRNSQSRHPLQQMA